MQSRVLYQILHPQWKSRLTAYLSYPFQCRPSCRREGQPTTNMVSTHSYHFLFSRGGFRTETCLYLQKNQQGKKPTYQLSNSLSGCIKNLTPNQIFRFLLLEAYSACVPDTWQIQNRTLKSCNKAIYTIVILPFTDLQKCKVLL